MSDQRLHLLVHDLGGLGIGRWQLRPSVAMRKARRSDEPAVLRIDSAAFEPLWRLGADGLDYALRATPLTRHRVATRGRAGEVVGYAVSGIAGERGYLQRLGVAPSTRRRGVGSALVIDALRWMRRRRAHDAIVNTQTDNDAALALYLDLGFVLVRSDLVLPEHPAEP